MLTAKDVREQVRRFHQREAIGGSDAEAFAPWWIHQQFQVAPADAAQTARSGDERLLDAFHVQAPEHGAPTLHLVKAQFSASLTEIAKGVEALAVALEHLREELDGDPSPVKENTIWTRLRARLVGVRGVDRLEVACKVVHLSERPEKELIAALRDEVERFQAAAGAHLGEYRVRLSFVGPGATRVSDGVERHPSAAQRIRFRGIDHAVDHSTGMWVGVASLADLVGIYDRAGDSLFSRNVRYFNFRGAERGPARHLSRTLEDMALAGGRVPPHHFALLHNGVSMHAGSARREGDFLEVRDSSVLNGCQTVKSAWLFREAAKRRKRELDEARWSEIMVPFRLVTTPDGELVQRITVSNNRQTAIRPSAFRANDPVQLELGRRFRDAKIFYERQESAFENLRRSNPGELEATYSASPHAPLRMEELAQAIAVAGDRPPISTAAKVSEIFTDDKVYRRVFDPSRLTSVTLLVFLRNVLAHLHLALKDARNADGGLEGMRLSSFRYPVGRALMRFIVARRPQLVTEYGSEVITRVGTTHPFRVELVRLLGKGKNNSRLLAELKAHWLDGGAWQSANDPDRMAACLEACELSEVDVFSTWESYRA